MLATDLARALDPALLMRDGGHPPDPWQVNLLRSERSRKLILCSRQSGKSTAVAAKALHRALYYPSSLILLLARAERQSKELFRKVIDLYSTLGRPVDPETENKLELELTNGSRIVSLPGVEGTVRSFSGVKLLIIDEASRVPDELYYSVRPMLAVSGGQLIGLTTPWGKRGWFYQEWTEGRDWERVKITAHECPRITPEFLEEEKAALPLMWYRQEYLVEFVDTIDQVFATEHVMAALSDEVEPLFA
jgi:terminase large subunit-like protein